MRSFHFFASLALLAALCPGEAAAMFCRTSSCNGMQGQVCTPAQPGDCGVPVYYLKPKVTFSIQKDASSQVSFSTIEATMLKAFQTWESVDCGGGQHPRIEVVEEDPATCALHEYSSDRGNANIVMFHDGIWPYDHNQFALTTVTFAADTGEIYDADLEINTADFTFTTGDTDVKADLLSIVTHESGHFLGLSHSIDAQDTMFPAYDQGHLEPRTLEQGDRDGICAIYPPGPISETCDGSPRHGFSALCAAQQSSPADPTVPDEDAQERCCCADGEKCTTGNVCEPSGCCSVAPGSGGAGMGPLALGLATLGAVLLARRRAGRKAAHSASAASGAARASISA